MLIQTPDSLRPIANFHYPPYIKNYFEEWFYKYFSQHGLKTDRVYLPVFWTTYYINNGYAPSPEIQSFLDSLDKTKKYFTIIQYDDGILENTTGLDLLVFSSAGRGDVTIPLYADGLDHIKPIPFDEKPIICSMIASNTHPIRKRLYDALKDVNGFYIKLDEKHDWETYIDIVNKSKVVLSPRGYGIHSFRFYEALKLGCFPVYFTDKYEPNIEKVFCNELIPYKLFKCYYTINTEINTLEDTKYISDSINYYSNAAKQKPQNITYESIYTYIIYKLNAEYLHP